MLENDPANVKLTAPLRGLSRADSACAGGKAATLGELARAGFPVPPGFVVTTAAFERFLAHNALLSAHTPAQVETAVLPADVVAAIQAAAALYTADGTPLAVRSSGVAEDLAAASYAGQYATVLGVRSTGALLEAVRRCWISAFSREVAAYGRARVGFSAGSAEERHLPAGPGPATQVPDAMAVLVQRQVEPDAAGVAFTANPVTGDRRETLVSAVRGLGDRLVSGQASADEWVVREREEGGTREAICQAAPEQAVNEAQVLTVAALARRVKAHFDAPQDVEWALCDGEVFLLQARPITALTVPAAPTAAETWRAPYPGGWARNFRFGEWLGDPVTPLFETWLLPALERAFWAALRRVADMPTPRPTYVVVHGWYFTSMNFWPPDAFGWFVRLALHPRLLRVLLQFNPALADWALGPWVREWRTVGLPHYRAVVEHAEKQVDRLGPDELQQLVDGVGAAAGDYFVWIALVAGAGYKTEAPLARFYRQHLFPLLGGSHRQLLAGLVDPALGIAAHAVNSLDWWQPTLGDLDLTDGATARRSAPHRPVPMVAARERAVAEARAALAHHPRRRRQFEQVLATAQRYARLREEIVSSFTLAWPVLRRAVQRLGDELVRVGVLDTPRDIFFLTHQEVVTMLRSGATASLKERAFRRRQAWERQRNLVPPLVLGRIPRVLKQGLDQLEATLAPAAAASGAPLRGLPASAGRATGPARIIRGPAEFARLRPGDVLVASATTPAWTPLFARAAAAITDTGSVLAHTSLVAREYGIPAVVGTGDATARLRDGQRVAVDGDTGVIELRSGSAG